jgi:hypothetical protein
VVSGLGGFLQSDGAMGDRISLPQEMLLLTQNLKKSKKRIKL